MSTDVRGNTLLSEFLCFLCSNAENIVIIDSFVFCSDVAGYALDNRIEVVGILGFEAVVPDGGFVVDVVKFEGGDDVFAKAGEFGHDELGTVLFDCLFIGCVAVAGFDGILFGVVDQNETIIVFDIGVHEFFGWECEILVQANHIERR